MFSEPPRLSVSACGGQACAKTLHFCTSEPCESAVKPAHSKAALLPDALRDQGSFVLLTENSARTLRVLIPGEGW